MGAGVQKRLTPKIRAYFEILGKEAALNATAAASKVGYKHPSKAGHRINKAWPELYEKAKKGYLDSLVMSAREVDERLAAVARDPKHKDHVKALELLARMHGKLETKLLVGGIDRSTLNKELDAMLEALKEQRAEQNVEGERLDGKPTAH
jgi:hypothetical protein